MRSFRWFAAQITFPAIGIAIAAWAMNDSPPTLLYSIDVLAKSVDPGDVVTAKYHGFINRLCPVISSEELVGSGQAIPLRTRIPNPQERQEPGEFTREVQLVIPLETPNGVYRIRSIASYDTNWQTWPWLACYAAHVIGPPERPESSFFWVGPVQWGQNSRSTK